MSAERITRRTAISSATGLTGLALSGAAFAQGAGARRVIIDTDPGVDDAFALLTGMLLDQQVPMEWAFKGPATIAQRLGAFNVKPFRKTAGSSNAAE